MRPGDWKKLSLEEKVGQLFSVRVEGQWSANKIPPDFLKLISTIPVGGMIVFGGDLTNIPALLHTLQQKCRIPYLISADLERGAGQQFRGATVFPPLMALGAVGSATIAYRVGEYTAREAKWIGIHQIYAPVLDVNINSNNPIVNIRSFGENENRVAELGVAMLKGIQSVGIAATAKHFPGHGDSEMDSHIDLPVIQKSLSKMEKIEIVPFQKAIQAGIKSIMVGHIAVPALDESKLPASLSEPIISQYLRLKLKYTGLVVTDALMMGGVLGNFSSGDIAVKAFQAGNDILLMPEDLSEAFHSLLLSVQKGTVSSDRFEDSLQRIYEMKRWLGLWDRRISKKTKIFSIPLTHSRLAKTVILKSLTQIGEMKDPVRTGSKNVFILYSKKEPEKNLKTFYRLIRGKWKKALVVLVDDEISSRRCHEIRHKINDSDQIVFVSWIVPQAWQKGIALSESCLGMLDWADEQNRSLLFIAFGNPYVVKGFSAKFPVLLSYGVDEVSQQKIFSVLTGRLKPVGIFPGKL